MNLMKNIVNINHLYKSYYSLNGETKTIEDLNFYIKNGEFLSLVGPSGCGKSTILNILSSLDNDYEGDIKFDIDNIVIGYMLQNDALFDWLSVYDNACIGLKIKGINNDENRKYVDSLIKKYGLYEFKNKKPSELSGGMRQRVALIRTLAIKPDLLILDEPFSALDYQTRLKVSDDVYKIIKNENISVIMVTHDISEAISMSDRIIVLSSRPCTVKNIYEVQLSNKSTPIDNRKSKEFGTYYDLIWRDLDE